jgi:pre-rRNA-processing protein TSR1
MEELEESEDEENDGDNERINRNLDPFDDNMSVLADAMEGAAVASTVDTISIAGIEDAIDEDEVQKFREEMDNLKWPDQVDTPMDELARVRFQRYRALKSFRYSLVIL